MTSEGASSHAGDFHSSDWWFEIGGSAVAFNDWAVRSGTLSKEIGPAKTKG